MTDQRSGHPTNVTSTSKDTKKRQEEATRVRRDPPGVGSDARSCLLAAAAAHRRVGSWSRCMLYSAPFRIHTALQIQSVADVGNGSDEPTEDAIFHSFLISVAGRRAISSEP